MTSDSCSKGAAFVCCATAYAPPRMAGQPRQMEAPLVYAVDDDMPFCDSLKWLLDSSGYRTVTYPSAERFLPSHVVDAAVCLLLDVKLPGMSGFDLQAELRRRGESLPVIFISSDPSAAARIHALRSGAAEFFDKPFSPEELLTALEHLRHVPQRRSALLRECLPRFPFQRSDT